MRKTASRERYRAREVEPGRVEKTDEGRRHEEGDRECNVDRAIESERERDAFGEDRERRRVRE